MLTVQSLGLQENSKLMAAIALTFALDVLDVYEKEYPADRRAYQTLEFCTEALITGISSEIVRAWVSYDMNDICSRKRHSGSKQAYAAARTILNAFYITTYDCKNSLAELYVLTETAAEAKQDNEGQYVHRILFPILDLILEYKIKHQEWVGDLEVIWEYLNQQQKDIVIFNLDILKNKSREIK